MAEIAVLKTHIINYSKSRDVYAGYKATGYSKKYLAEHERDIIIHKAAKKAFDELDVKKLPTVRSLQDKYAKLLAGKWRRIPSTVPPAMKRSYLFTRITSTVFSAPTNAKQDRKRTLPVVNRHVAGISTKSI